MCFGCDCPEPIPPPNQTISRCRKMLQILALSLLVIGIIGIVAGPNFVFQFIYDLLLVYLLYISWTQFNWCMTLMFFLFCTMQTIQSLIVIIGLIQYGQFFSNKNNIVISLYCLLSVVYYPVAVYFSHYCYKNFKHYFLGNQGLGFGNNRPGNGGGQVGNGGDDYRRVDDNNQGQQPVFGQPVFARGNNNNNNDQNRQQQNNNNNNFFRGQGVRIG